MASRLSEKLRLIRAYRERTGIVELDMRKVAEFAVGLGWRLPPPADPLDNLAQQFADAARTEIRTDPKTGEPYRANHAVPRRGRGGQLTFFWVDIDDPHTTKDNMRASLGMRWSQVVDDSLQLTLDLERWNKLRPAEQIELPMNLHRDIAGRRAANDKRA